MHIFVSGIGGTAMGPLAHIAKQAGFKVSGSDKQDSGYIAYLKKHGITDVHIGQTREQIAAVHSKNPIDWYVYSSAVAIENPNSPELVFCKEQDIPTSKRDEMINLILHENNLKMIAIAGTHGKTTTTAMVIWLFKQLGKPQSYSVGAKIPFGDMGQFHKNSEYFIYEADEFDRNFLAFEPYISLITGVSWDHHEIFPTRESYKEAFEDFLGQSTFSYLWDEDQAYLGINPEHYHHMHILDSSDKEIHNIKLAGLYNRLDGWLAIQAVAHLTQEPVEKLVDIINKFPGSQRRMEQIIPNLYSDYAHTPEKVRGGMSIALEMAEKNGQDLVVVYEPLTNRRQHYMMDEYKDSFNGAKKLYWLPSYLAREDPQQRIIPPEELISRLSNPEIAQAAKMGDSLQKTIREHLKKGDLVVCMTGGGGGSLDEWIREKFKP